MKVNFNANLSVCRQAPGKPGAGGLSADSLNSLITVSIGGTLLMAMLGGAQGFLILFLLFGAAATAWMVYSLSKNVPKEIADQGGCLAVQMAAQGNVTGPMAPPRPPQPPPPPPPSPQPPPPPPPPEASDIVFVMRKLVELRDIETLALEEFEAKKAELLKRL